MAEEKHVSGMTVGPLLSEEQHAAVIETRERRKQVAQQSAAQRRGQPKQTSGDQPSTPKSKG